MGPGARRYRLFQRLLRFAVTLFGLLLVLMPLTLWVAWSQAVYYGALASLVIAVVAFFLLAWLLHRLQVLLPRAGGVPPAGAAYADPLLERAARDRATAPADAAGGPGRKDGLWLVAATAAVVFASGCGLLAAAWLMAFSRFAD